MKNFNYLSTEDETATFYKQPESFNKRTEKELLAYALGATLYMPATRLTITEEIVSGKHLGLSSMVICLEDSIGDHEVQLAEDNLILQMSTLALSVRNGLLDVANLPLIFLRVRNPEQVSRIIERLEFKAELLAGFVFPKFSADSTGQSYWELLKHYNNQLTGPVYGMPIIETPRVMNRESRIPELLAIKQLLNGYSDLVLNVRIGATDFSGLFGIRRGPDVTIYDIATINHCIADIINVFARVESGYVVSGPVWEYFANGGRLLKPQLRKSPFEEFYGTSGTKVRGQLLNKYIDGLIREVILDKENGLVGKTIIHPTHIIPVQALYVVSHEEYVDACNIYYNDATQLGVFKSEYINKMNEIKPHYNWARRIIARSKIYGVFHEHHNFTSLLAEHI
ncbi:MAG TPA: HpcH/HpaI aldolase/citrate lyase family protein [Candidatus Deferrimicrobium sp.]|nr:HpcH/HpaI aldolase/citrate lyase family protein [Candidatus Deferrimicrobium sp.]